MIGRDRIRAILVEGRDVDDEQYRTHPVINMVKTFYFFCQRLVVEPADVPLPSTVLNEHIHAHLLGRNVAVDKNFNPHGWFSKAWTDWESNGSNYFKSEYSDVLERTGNDSTDDPWSYRIRPDCFSSVVTILAESSPEIILQVGAMGGSITLEGRRDARSAWQFRVITNEAMVDYLMGEEPPPQEDVPWVTSWEAALTLLDRYPWPRLHPVDIHPEFAEATLAAVAARATDDSTEVDRWRESMDQ